MNNNLSTGLVGNGEIQAIHPRVQGLKDAGLIQNGEYIFIVLSFYNSGFYNNEYSLLSGNIEEKEVDILKKDIPKKKKPYITLLTNVALPVGVLPLLEIYVVLHYFGGHWEDYRAGMVFTAPIVFTLTTIPAHIYVKDSFVKTACLIAGKFFSSLVMVAGVMAPMRCLDSEEEECERAKISAIVMISIGGSGLAGIYIYEVIDTYRSAVRYNKKLEERKSSQSTFFIQPFITPKGDIFLTGGVRF